jgi:hypothetical protein
MAATTQYVQQQGEAERLKAEDHQVETYAQSHVADVDVGLALTAITKDAQLLGVL